MNRVPAPGLSSKKSEITRPLLLQLVNIVLPHSRDVEEFITFYYEDVAKRQLPHGSFGSPASSFSLRRRKSGWRSAELDPVST